MQEIFEGIIGKILDECANEMFSAEVYNDEFDGTTITNLICLGNVRDILERNIDEFKKVPFEAFEKLKERLIAGFDKESNSPVKKIRLCDAIEIVNQVAEEYVTDTNVGNKDGWIPFTEREADEEEKETYGCDMMLSCKLPEEDEEILVTYKNGYVDTDTFFERWI